MESSPRLRETLNFMSDTLHAVGNPRASDRRCRPRQRSLFSCIQLDDENGGVVLNISAHGLAMQVLRSLTDDRLLHIRFLLSQSQAWVETRGRIAWISASKKTAGVEFIGLPNGARNQIEQWISLDLHSNASVEGNMLSENTERVKDVRATHRPESAIPFPEPETGSVVENQNEYAIAENAVEGPPSVKTTNADIVLEHPRIKSTTLGPTEEASGTAASPLAWSYIDPSLARSIETRERAGAFRKSGPLIGLTVGTVLLLSALFFLAYHLQKKGNSHPHTEVTAAAKTPESSTDNSAHPESSAVDPVPPSGGPGFMLQVGAMAHKENADALVQALQRRNFPVFVSQGADRFYRVVVGPYTDVDSTLRAKEELKEQGFASIRTPRNRSAK